MQSQGIFCENAAWLDIGTGGCHDDKILLRADIDQASDRNNTQSIWVIALASVIKLVRAALRAKEVKTRGMIFEVLKEIIVTCVGPAGLLRISTRQHSTLRQQFPRQAWPQHVLSISIALPLTYYSINNSKNIN